MYHIDSINILQNKLITLILKILELTSINDDWTYLERFMEINNKKITISQPLQQQVSQDSCSYHNGIVFEKNINTNIIMIMTYTCLDRICVVSNISYHDIHFKTIDMITNLFSYGELHSNPSTDPEPLKYLIETISSYIDIAIETKTTFWDIKK